MVRRKRLKRLAGAVLLGTVLFVLPVQASGNAGQTDEEPIVGGMVSAAQVQKGETLKYGFSVQNKLGMCSSHLSCSETVCVIWMSEGGQTIEQNLPYHWRERVNGELEITDGMEEGKWKILSIVFIDPYASDKLSARQYGLTVSENDENGQNVKDDLSFSEFTVQGTKADRKAPVVKKKSIGLTGNTVKKKGKTKFYLKARDKSPMRYVICGWRNTATKDITYREMNYNKKKERYEYTISAPDFGKKGNLRLVRVEACDRYGNKTLMKQKKLPKLTVTRSKTKKNG